MCLILIAWKSHPRYPVILAANRDEFYERPSVPAHFWKEAPQVLAGRDLRQGGTWLGLHRDGRFAAITNFRGGQPPLPHKRSRGELVATYLFGEQTPGTFNQSVTQRRQDYNPFNLLAGNSNELSYCDDQRGDHQILPPGLYALGNDRLDRGGDKEAAGIQALRDTLYRRASTDSLLDMLRDNQPSGNSDNALEQGLSARFIHLPEAGYGTRASTVLLIDNDGNMEFAEQSYDAAGEPGERLRFQLEATTVLS